MSWGDVRGLLQYVPQFRGKVFVIVINAPIPALAESMLDLVTLQNIGVQLVVSSTVHSADELLDRAAEAELKYAERVFGMVDEPDEVVSTLARGQAVFLDAAGSEPMASDLAAFAIALKAKKLILLRGEGGGIPSGAIRAADIESDEPQLLLSAAAACGGGIARVHLLDGSQPGILLDELFSNEGVGTMVYADSYRTIRPLREEDIVELLGMIGRSVRNAHLVPRDYLAVTNRMKDYYVMEIDGNVVGSVALYRYDDQDAAEIACLYVKQAHEGLGYGVELVSHAEKLAKTQGVSTVFALTNRAASFFQQQGYEEQPADQIPAPRYEQLVASGRDSRVFAKHFA